MHVVLNMAASLDGRVAGAGGQPVRLSSEEDIRRVHRLRAASDAILVGIGTVVNDDPRLTARPEPRPDPIEQPLRVVVDSNLRIPRDARVLDEEAPTLILAAQPGEVAGADVETVPGDDGVDLAAGLRSLEQRGIEQLMVEGGPTIAAALLAGGFVDRVHLYVAARVLGEGPSLSDALDGVSIDLEPRSRGPLGEGTLLSYGVPR